MDLLNAGVAVNNFYHTSSGEETLESTTPLQTQPFRRSMPGYHRDQQRVRQLRKGIMFPKDCDLDEGPGILRWPETHIADGS